MDPNFNFRYCLLLVVTIFMLPLNAQDEIDRVAQNLRTDIIKEGEPLMTLSDRMKHYNVPGVSIAVVENFELAGATTFGKVDAGSPAGLTVETAFQSASISKLVNAVGLMKLVEAGKLDLDQNINEILKSWQIPPSSEYPDAVITVRMILTHSAGLSNHGFDGYKSVEGLPTVLDILNVEKGVKANPFEILIEPGTTFKYSGGGTLMTQLLIEEMSGKTYPEYMQETVLQPLGMTNSFYSVNQAGRKDQLATAHLANGKPLKGNYRYYPESAAGGLWSTPTDLSKVMIDLMLAFKGEEGRLLKPATAKAMLEPTEASVNAALGLFRNDKNGHLYFEHSGANEGFMANFVGSTSGGHGAIVMQNGEQYALVPEVINSIATVYAWDSWFPPESTVAADVTEDKSLWKAYEGHYTSENDKAKSFDVKVKKGKLMMSRSKAWSLPLVLIATDKYLLQGASPAVTVEFVGEGELRVTQGEVAIYRKE